MVLLASQLRLYKLYLTLLYIYFDAHQYIQVECAVGFWANLSVSDKTANQSVVKPFNKRKGKMVKSEPDSQPLDNPPEEANASKGSRKNEDDCFGRIEEFNADAWSAAMKGWVAGTLHKGFDSMAIMQPLVNVAMLVTVQGNLNRTCLIALSSAIGPSSHSRCKIAEGAISNSE